MEFYTATPGNIFEFTPSNSGTIQIGPGGNGLPSGVQILPVNNGIQLLPGGNALPIKPTGRKVGINAGYYTEGEDAQKNDFLIEVFTKYPTLTPMELELIASPFEGYSNVYDLTRKALEKKFAAPAPKLQTSEMPLDYNGNAAQPQNMVATTPPEPAKSNTNLIFGVVGAVLLTGAAIYVIKKRKKTAKLSGVKRISVAKKSTKRRTKRTKTKQTHKTVSI